MSTVAVFASACGGAAGASLKRLQLRGPGQLGCLASLAGAKLAQVLREIAALYGGMELALWFCSPNSALSDRVPALLLTSYPQEAVAAARQLRFAVLTN